MTDELQHAPDCGKPDEALFRQALRALEYASDITDPQGENCQCLICVGIDALRDRLRGIKLSKNLRSGSQ